MKIEIFDVFGIESGDEPSFPISFKMICMKSKVMSRKLAGFLNFLQVVLISMFLNFRV